VAGVLRSLEAACSFHSFFGQNPDRPFAKQRKQLRRLVKALRALEDELNIIQDQESAGQIARGSLSPWSRRWDVVEEARTRDSPFMPIYPSGHPFGFGVWLATLVCMRHSADDLLEFADGPAKPGARGDPALRELLLDVALILGRTGLRLSVDTEGLFAHCARAAAERAGRQPLPLDPRDKLRPVVRIARHMLTVRDALQSRRV
jgi:hypothetical protein